MCVLMDALSVTRFVHYLVGITFVCGVYVMLIRTNLNLRFRDPSMTVAQVITTMWPAVYVMYHVGIPQARTPFLLIGVVGVLFGVFALDFRRMLLVCTGVLASYVTVMLSLMRWAPERVDLRVEAINTIAFAVVLFLVTYVGTYMWRLRSALRDRNARLEKAMAELRDLAARDPLTGLPNRRAALERLHEEAARCRERGASDLLVGILDVDHFKHVNDTLGHQVGDEVLREVAGVLRDGMRGRDFVARYGGEEFVLYLHASSENAHAVSERLLGLIREADLPSLGGRGRITASLGVTFHQIEERVEETLARADRALYVAKQEGRDRVVLSAPAPVDALVSG